MENGAVISGALVPASCSQVAGRPVKPVKLPELLGFTDFSQLPQAKPQSHKEAFSVKPSAICLQPTNRSFKRKKKSPFLVWKCPFPHALSWHGPERRPCSSSSFLQESATAVHGRGQNLQSSHRPKSRWYKESLA